MKLVYCPSCRHVSMRAHVEKDTCERCRGTARVMHVRRPWQSFAGLAIVLAGATFLILPQVAAGIPWAPLVETLALRLVWLVVIVGLAFFFSNWGVRVMKGEALARGAETYPEANP